MSFNQITVGGIVLVPLLDGYTQFWEGEEIQFTGSSTVQVLSIPKRFGCEVTVRDGRRSIYLGLLALLNGQFPGGIPVDDQVSGIGSMLMYITDLKQVGGSASFGGNSLSKGTSVKLIETTRRYTL